MYTALQVCVLPLKFISDTICYRKFTIFWKINFTPIISNQLKIIFLISDKPGMELAYASFLKQRHVVGHASF